MLTLLAGGSLELLDSVCSSAPDCSLKGRGFVLCLLQSDRVLPGC